MIFNRYVEQAIGGTDHHGFTIAVKHVSRAVGSVMFPHTTRRKTRTAGAHSFGPEGETGSDIVPPARATEQAAWDKASLPEGVLSASASVSVSASVSGAVAAGNGGQGDKR